MPDDRNSPQFPTNHLGYFFAFICAASVLGMTLGWGSTAGLAPVALVSLGGMLLLPILPYLESFDVSPKGIKAQIRVVKIQLNEQAKEQELIKKEQAEQQEIIKKIVIYSLGQFPFEMLLALKYNMEYIYIDSENMRRWANTLLDNGYIEPKISDGSLEFNPEMNGRNLVDLAKPTPAGDFLISLRQDPSTLRR